MTDSSKNMTASSKHMTDTSKKQPRTPSFWQTRPVKLPDPRVSVKGIRSELHTTPPHSNRARPTNRDAAARSDQELIECMQFEGTITNPKNRTELMCSILLNKNNPFVEFMKRSMAAACVLVDAMRDMASLASWARALKSNIIN